MKNNLMAAIITLLLVSGCTTKQEYSYTADKWEVHSENGLAYKNTVVQYRVELKNDNLPEWTSNLDGEKFLKSAFNKVYNASITALDPMYNPHDTIIILSKESLNERLNIAPEDNANIQEFLSIGFNEEWCFDEKELYLKKKINHWFPVRHFYKETDTLKSRELLRKAFLLDFSKGNPAKGKYTLLAKNIRTEFPFTYDFNQSFPAIDFKRFVGTLINKVLSGETLAYQPSYNRDLKKIPYKLEELLENHGDVLKNRQENITLIIFDEDWYIDETTLKIDKKINGVTLVEEFYRGMADEKTKRMLMYIPFKEKEMKPL